MSCIINITCSLCRKTVAEVLYDNDGNRYDVLKSKCCGSQRF